ncbi:MAG: DUF4440 domain-containing protein [Proteobacteria bacterium]|nr:DUF4440 domain-containing protein [Pseudomonadota bacterium]
MILRPAAALALLLFTTAAARAQTAVPELGAAADPAAVEAAERAFAAEAVVQGERASFLHAAADDAVFLNPKLSLAKPRIEKWPERLEPSPLLWAPVFVGVSRSGDLGFSTGPWVRENRSSYGMYFTIWKRGSGGVWKWTLDQGYALSAPPAFPPPAHADFAPVSDVAPAPPEQAFAQVRSLDSRLNADLAAGRTDAIAQLAAADARVMGLEPLATGREAALAAAGRRPKAIAATFQGGESSGAGDLAYTYGVCDWQSPQASAVHGVYVRVWQRRSAGWILLLEEVAPL